MNAVGSSEQPTEDHRNNDHRFFTKRTHKAKRFLKGFQSVRRKSWTLEFPQSVSEETKTETIYSGIYKAMI